MRCVQHTAGIHTALVKFINNNNSNRETKKEKKDKKDKKAKKEKPYQVLLFVKFMNNNCSKRETNALNRVSLQACLLLRARV